MKRQLVINGTTHELTFDNWGSPLVDGKSIDEFIKTCSKEDMAFLANKGFSVMNNEPEHFDDIVERHEL